MSLKITIPEPCHESWSRMTPAEKGRFCASCQKCVVDFTNMPDKEVKAYLVQHAGERVCGKMSEQQLFRLNRPEPQPAPWWLKTAAAVGLAAVVAPAVAQEVQPEKQQVKVQQNVGNEHTTSQEGKGVSEKQVQDSVLVSLKGKVLDKETKEEMPFVTIILKEKEGKQIAVSQTDIEGDFKLNFTKADLNTSKVYELEVITIGYSKYIMTFNYSELVSADKLSFKLEPSQTLIGEMVIMGYIVPVIDKETSLSRETVWKRVGNRFERVK